MRAHSTLRFVNVPQVDVLFFTSHRHPVLWFAAHNQPTQISSIYFLCEAMRLSADPALNHAIWPSLNEWARGIVWSGRQYPA